MSPPSSQKQSKRQESEPPSDGCRICGRDDDHAHLLLCESCNDEYHTYCLGISQVPEGDFYCPNCQKTKKHLKSFCRNDNLDEQVAALPPPFTSRFGEIIWAAGGNGFGWWPACIYDPRLTVGGARKLALKNIGKKHLVYFFGCTDTPFTVLTDAKCMNWDLGLLEDMDNGKTAKSMGKTRALMFEWALQAAVNENEKPIEYRLDWNHEEDPFIAGKGNSNNGGTNNSNSNAANAEPTSSADLRRSSAGGGRSNTSTKKKKKRPAAALESSSKAPSTSTLNSTTTDSQTSDNDASSIHADKRAKTSGKQASSPKAGPSLVPVRRSARDRKPSRSISSPNNSMHKPSTNFVLNSTSTPDAALKRNSQSETKRSKSSHLPIGSPRQRFFCSILRNDNITSTATSMLDPEDDLIRIIKESTSTRNIGFITIPDKSCTFDQAREVIEKDLDVESSDDASGDCLPSKFKFFVPNLGPMSRKQEQKFGPMLEFLSPADAEDMSDNERSRFAAQFGDGSKRNPLKVIVYKCR